MGYFIFYVKSVGKYHNVLDFPTKLPLVKTISCNSTQFHVTPRYFIPLFPRHAL